MQRTLFIACLFAGLNFNCAIPPQPSAKPSRTSTAPTTAPLINRDDCATRLHEIAGALLFYISQNHHLPQRLSELSNVPGAPTDWTCPVSGQPYVFDPAGLPTADPTLRVVVYDAVPA